ncbi:MAG: hypothetical protein JRI57_01030 [Deltaproteobacteria bacterium]|nr:hypothetical protein [Deltaproteobacteria bacterium]MBW1952402.1 hypothetical protein [Deltaproteobacteria bacterium]MBW1985913.1 hypothetical protein [Deltaproteobacteria bacterium]MBW2133673.1 hypothetical protein [Deltaproteobacteria bacterium]
MDNCKKKAGAATWFKFKLALILVQEGETREEAWIRHLTEYPEDFQATIKIFNLPGVYRREL